MLCFPHTQIKHLLSPLPASERATFHIQFSSSCTWEANPASLPASQPVRYSDRPFLTFTQQPVTRLYCVCQTFRLDLGIQSKTMLSEKQSGFREKGKSTRHVTTRRSRTQSNSQWIYTVRIANKRSPAVHSVLWEGR